MIQQHRIFQKVAPLLIASLFLLTQPCHGSFITTDVTNPDANENNQGTQSPSDSADEVYNEKAPESIWEGIDLLVAIFFVLAASWLFLAIVYSLILLLLLRLQARGRLDRDDESFGRLTFCNGRCSLYLGCFARRYATRLEMARNGETPPLRIMTRGERRAAMESLLALPTEAKLVDTAEIGKSGDIDEDGDGPVCTICLAGYEHTDDQVFSATKCQHRFHKECILDWLERKDNTECPVCRESMVSSEKVWSYVENMRKEQRPFRRLLQRCRQWFHSNDDSSDRSTSDVDSSPSLTDDEEIVSDVEQDAGHGSAETSPGNQSRTSSSDKDEGDVEQGAGHGSAETSPGIQSRTSSSDKDVSDVEQGAGHGSAETSPGIQSRTSSSDKDSIL